MADTLSADFVVVGSGIIGSLVARKLALAGAVGDHPRGRTARHARRTGGAFQQFAAPQRLDVALSAGSPGRHIRSTSPKPTIIWCRPGPIPTPPNISAQVGGTSWHWAAHAWRNVPNDFRIKSLYGVGVDWPFEL